ncbi:ABC transporter permease [Vibrio viridaestus]|uniref:Transport permease protein n=1 Tax=Vibrio viridaestus TaxID=2487322 RepID=A0A3N9TC73_9VIBR|nr:ABC transporter permease [Vibrio viridaestus]RQW61751.1 ABC transporter permease [Vibrio viridaestus]
MWVRIYAMLLKEFRQLSRDRMTFGMIVMIPLVQLLLFGYAINTDVRHVPSAIVDLSDSQLSRHLIQSIEASQSVDFIATYPSVKQAEEALRAGDVKAIFYIPSDFYQRLIIHPAYTNHQERNALIQPVAQWIVDGSDTLVAATIKGLRTMPLDELAGRAIDKTTPSFSMVPYFNPEQRTVINIVPGLLAVILTMTMVMFTAAAIVREREHGNMEFLITTPIRPFELMIGKIVPFVLVGLIQVTIILTVGHFLFGVPIRGGLLTLLCAALLFIFASLTLGLVISTIAKTQLQAMQLTVFILLPSILLSGFMFPYDAMPEAAQWIAECLPATHFMRMIRAVVLKGATLDMLSSDVIWLSLFTIAGVIIASLRFHKRLG